MAYQTYLSYHFFENIIDKSKINTIFELGSRDLVDAIRLSKVYNAKVYAFECNPDCIFECKKNLQNLDYNSKNNIVFVDKAVALNDGEVSFFPFDLNKYNNMGSSSMYKIDFSMRDNNDPDYNRENPQYEIKVDGTRLDTFVKENNINNIDMICLDLQGYELNALKSLGDELHNVKYIITECAIQSTYIGGNTFQELNEYLKQYNFKYIYSDRFGSNFPDLSINGYSEFDALFVRY